MSFQRWGRSYLLPAVRHSPGSYFSKYLCSLILRGLLARFRMDPNIPEVIRTVPLQYYVLFATVLFAIGVTGVLLRRNAIIIFMCVELMLNAVNILLTAFSAYRADPNGQIFVFFIMAVAAAEVAVGLGIIVMIYRNLQNTDVNLLSRLKW